MESAMFIGHYAPAFIAATRRGRPRLAVAFIAVQLIDLAFFSLALLGIEHLRLVPGFTRMNPMDLYDMPWDHSLLGAAGWAIGFALLLRARGFDWRGAGIVAALVLSHWFIDLLVHTRDLTLWGRPPKLGLGLWNHPLIEMTTELVFAFGGFAWYLAHTRATRAAGRWAALVLGLAMAALQAFDWFGPRPTAIVDPAPASLGAMGIIAYVLLAALAWWLSANRETKPQR